MLHLPGKQGAKSRSRSRSGSGQRKPAVTAPNIEIVELVQEPVEEEKKQHMA